MPRARDAVGTLIVDWSVRGTKDADPCGADASGTIDILVQDASGAVVGRFQQRCAALATSIPLRPGNYTATAALFDDASGDRTTRAAVPAFSIQGNDEVTAPIDFPEASFL